jgi:inhibitor of cysteine peptidase
VFAACTPTVVVTPLTDDGGLQFGEIASIDSVDVLLLESFPVQVQAVIKGTLPSACAEIDGIYVERDKETYRITISTSHPVASVCTQVKVPFEKTVSLDVVDLPVGTYTVDVYGKTAEFTLNIKTNVSDE